MSLKVEVYTSDGKWILVKTLNPGDRPGSISNTIEGRRDVYLFECSKDDTYSALYRSKFGLDSEHKDLRIVSSIGMELIKKLEEGDSPYELRVKTDQSSKERQIRFTHI